MKIVFVSNYMTHHQLPFCKLLYEKLGDDFCFVADKPFRKERADLGYADYNKELSFILCAYDGVVEKSLALHKIDEADVVLHGDAPLSYIENRLKMKKLTFRGVERIYKQKYNPWKLPIRIIKHYWSLSRFKNFYLLCASAYTAGDYAKSFAFLNRAYRWGYFPECKHYDVDQLMADKEPASILWAGRFIDWKYPDHAVNLAKRLKSAGYKFKLRMIGMGDMDEQLRRTVEEQQLEDCVEFTGPVKPDQVRSYMEKAQIYLFTSNRQEGWGAVLNESMNSGCAVVASSAAGATPFLIQSGENGLSYDQNSQEQLYAHVAMLLDHPQRCNAMGRKAYETMVGTWNVETAVNRFMMLSEALLRGEKSPELFESGPCSKAPIIKD